mmetsp:Transcript_29789/g.52296  ORF Transcript_29789/g.52296 Transcript_29789/m.52296 type:complete len:549 (-) Transcript_29789:75-1721(-)
MLEVLNIDQSVEVSADRQLTLEGAVDLVLDTGLEHLVHLSLQTSEVVLLRFARRDKEDALVRKAGVGAEIFTNDFHGLFLVKSHIPHSVFDFEINLSTNSEVRHTVAAHFLHKSKVGFGETTSGNDDDKIEVLDSHNAQVVVERELRGSGTGKVPKAEVFAGGALGSILEELAGSISEGVRGSVNGGFDVSNLSGTLVLRVKATEAVHERRLSGTRASSDSKVGGSLVTGFLHPLRHRVSEDFVVVEVGGGATAFFVELVNREEGEIDGVHTTGVPFLSAGTHLTRLWVTNVTEVARNGDEVALLGLLGELADALELGRGSEVDSESEEVSGVRVVGGLGFGELDDFPVRSEVDIFVLEVVGLVLVDEHILLRSLGGLGVLLKDVETHVEVGESPPGHSVELESHGEKTRSFGNFPEDGVEVASAGRDGGRNVLRKATFVTTDNIVPEFGVHVRELLNIFLFVDDLGGLVAKPVVGSLSGNGHRAALHSHARGHRCAPGYVVVLDTGLRVSSNAGHRGNSRSRGDAGGKGRIGGRASIEEEDGSDGKA